MSTHHDMTGEPHPVEGDLGAGRKKAAKALDAARKRHEKKHNETRRADILAHIEEIHPGLEAVAENASEDLAREHIAEAVKLREGTDDDVQAAVAEWEARRA